MYPQLAAGAEIHIIPERLRMDLPGIRDYIERERITGALKRMTIFFKASPSFQMQ